MFITAVVYASDVSWFYVRRGRLALIVRLTVLGSSALTGFNAVSHSKLSAGLGTAGGYCRAFYFRFSTTGLISATLLSVSLVCDGPDTLILRLRAPNLLVFLLLHLRYCVVVVLSLLGFDSWY